MSDPMSELGLEEDSANSWWSLGWIITVVGIIWFLSFLWTDRTSLRPNSDHHTSTCKSTSCARCRVLASSQFTQRFQQRCEDLFSTSIFSPETKTQIRSLVQGSVNHKDDILATIYDQSGYKLTSDGGRSEVENLPLIWMLPELERRPFWKTSDEYLSSLRSSLEHPTTFQAIREEFTLADEVGKGWKINSVPIGKWRVYGILNQGVWMDENASRCPVTTQLLKDLPGFLQRHVFGNAMFSVLEAGSKIEPHTGPCNFRLRCHLPLVAPPGYKMRVGRDVRTWDEGKLMVFDDSFVHEVWHEEGVERLGVEGFPGRAVLIFDIWHPQVAADQRSAIQYIYDSQT